MPKGMNEWMKINDGKRIATMKKSSREIQIHLGDQGLSEKVLLTLKSEGWIS